jgi:hypothetical protein
MAEFSQIASRRFDNGYARGRRLEVPTIECQQRRGLRLTRTLANQRVVSSSATHIFCRQAAKERHAGGTIQGNNAAPRDKIRFQNCPCVLRGQPVRRRQPRQDCVCFRQSLRQDYQAFAASQPAFDFRGGCGVTFVPTADCSHHAACIESEEYRCHL